MEKEVLSGYIEIAEVLSSDGWVKEWEYNNPQIIPCLARRIIKIPIKLFIGNHLMEKYEEPKIHWSDNGKILLLVR